MTIEKELLAIVFALEKFCSYLLGSKIIVFSYHKPDVKTRLIWCISNTEIKSLWINSDSSENAYQLVSTCEQCQKVGKPLVSMKFPSNLSCSVKSLMFGILISWGHSQSPMDFFPNIELTRLSSNAIWPTTKLTSKESSNYKNWTNSTWKPMRTIGYISRRLISHILYTSQELKMARSSKVKQFHDQQILRKEFRVGHKLIAGKLHSKSDGPFVITSIFPYGVVELKDENTNNTFQVNGHQIKLFYESPAPTVGEMETISLMEPAPPDDTP
ncbi:hypothetical protein CR513_06950, partial [Mucuna pruriens]